WADRAGGTSGALWGLALRSVGTALGDEVAPGRTDVATGVQAAVDGIMSFGKAEVGQKTMVDALVPFTTTLSAAVADGSDLVAAWTTAAAAASTAAAETADLLPKMGRARPHAEKSLGTVDAGAYSFGLIVTAIVPVLERAASTTAPDSTTTNEGVHA
ncbi:DAK2 domain-containing protein, partial [Plantibacter sp. CFBP 13570]|uniref:DAK2 domain-containing protein n=1 Tax=Plantibacter sp. CFBP 13570 TaxID=2775272 RepID=UPI00193098D6